jgi:hypothetical protein
MTAKPVATACRGQKQTQIRSGTRKRPTEDSLEANTLRDTDGFILTRMEPIARWYM